MGKIIKIAITGLISIFFICLLPLPAYSKTGLEGLGMLGLIPLYFLVNLILLLGWSFIHMRSKDGIKNILILRTIYDLIIILYSVPTLSFFIFVNSTYIRAIVEPIRVADEYFLFYAYRLIFLLILLILILYKMNKWVSLRINRIGIHFILCLTLIITLLTIFEPSVAGPITRWFVDPVKLLKLYDNPRIYNERLKYYGFKEKDALNVNVLITALQNANTDIRENAARALGDIKGQQAVEPIIIAMNDDNKRVSNEAKKSLIKIGSPSVEPLIAALKDEKPNIRVMAAGALGDIKDQRAVEPLISVLNDEQAAIKAAAIESLGKIEDSRAVEPIIAALKDENSLIRSKAAQALGNIKVSRAVEQLIPVLKDNDPDVRQKTVWALGEIKDSRAVEPLIIYFKDEKWKDEEKRDKNAAQQEKSLARRSIPSWLTKKNVSQQEIIDALIKIGFPSAKYLIALLSDKGLEIRWKG
jgi:hypothetical protein